MPTNEIGTPHSHNDELDDQLEKLADHLQAGAPAGGELVALLPCEPAIGRVVVICWQLEIPAEEKLAEDMSGDEVDHVWELARLDSGERLDDPKALREALALVSMAEAIEELADPEALEALANGMDAWCERADAGSEDRDGAASAARGEIIAAVAKSVVRTIDLLKVIDGDGARIATPLELDRIGGLLRELEREFTSTERAAERWIQGGAWESDRDLVEGLWSALSRARRGPLKIPVSAALEQGREAGLALAAQVTGG